MKQQSVPGVGNRPSALHVALEAIRSPAAVVGSDGELLEANTVARQLFAQEDRRDVLLRAIRAPGEHRDWTVVSVRADASEAYFVIGPGLLDDESRRRLQRATRRWKLTRRQCEVLEQIAEGRSNAAIAALLGISARTVEIHVTALLDKAGVDSRSELIVKLLTIDTP